nr:MAG TPA: type I neck protein [Caudoviricetes sp.]
MAKFSATTVKSLQDEIMRRANLALDNEVANNVKEKLKSHVQKDIYSTYSPVEYERRKENGGLVDENNIRHKVRERTLYVYEEAPIEGPRLDAPNWVSKPDSLARIIEDGAYNPWNYRNYQWTKPRPFMENTQDDINYRYADIVKLLKNRIEHDN